MEYIIKWKKAGAANWGFNLYTETVDRKGLNKVLDFLETYDSEYELVSIEPYTD